MGDFNAKLGDDNRGYEEIMGKCGLGEMNEKGEMLANFCSTNQLVIVCSHTEEFTKQHGYHLTTRLRIK